MFNKTVNVPDKLTMNVYAVYDRKAKVYAQPMLLTNDEVAIRVFTMSITPGTMLYSFPEDYVLAYLGTFDEHTGQYEDQENAHFIAEAKDWKGVIDEVQESGAADESGKEA